MAVNDTKDQRVAAIFGVTGLVGKELAKKLLSIRKWKIYGIARNQDRICTNNVDIVADDYHFISCDLLDSIETQEKLATRFQDVTHIFWVTWASQYPVDSRECFEQNQAMMSNVLKAILPSSKALKHVSLQTGTKHYVSLRRGQVINRCYDEDSPRVNDGGHNFYYALEDLLQEKLDGKLVVWSVHRPGLIVGSSKRTLYNFMGSLCVYGTICKYLSLPFVFGGSKQCWEEMCVDASDARLVADQHIWAATNHGNMIIQPRGGEAFNCVNGESYSWKEIWGAIGVKLGVKVCDDDEATMFSESFMFSSAMADKGSVWKEIVEKEGLVDTEMEELANWDFIDVLFRCPVKILATRDKVNKLGFQTKYQALDSVLYWIDVMRDEKLIP